MEPREYCAQNGISRAYDPFDLKDVDAPWLTHGDRKARRAFRKLCLKYLVKHKAKMRKRDPRDRVVPQAVVELIKHGLLEYVCRRMLKPKYQSPFRSLCTFQGGCPRHDTQGRPRLLWRETKEHRGHRRRSTPSSSSAAFLHAPSVFS